MPQPKAVALGLGGAGNDLLTHLMDLGFQGLHCVAVDTDRYDLQISRAHSKLLVQHAGNTGTRGDAEIGRKLALQASGELQSVLGGTEIVFILAGMGGGTGGGAGPIIAEAARKKGSLVIGLVTKPFHFERGRFHVAIKSIRQMVDACDTVILIDNHTFEQSSMTLPSRLSLDTAGQTCCSVVQSLTHTFADSDSHNAELRELRTMLRCGGLGKASVGQSHSHLGAEEAALRALRGTMAHGDLADASGLFVNITGGIHMQQTHVESVLELFSRRISPSARFLHSHGVDTNMHGVTSVTLIATGISFPPSWGRYRTLPLELYDLEPESAEEEDLHLELGLQQLESFAN